MDGTGRYLALTVRLRLGAALERAYFLMKASVMEAPALLTSPPAAIPDSALAEVELELVQTPTPIAS